MIESNDYPNVMRSGSTSLDGFNPDYNRNGKLVLNTRFMDDMEQRIRNQQRLRLVEMEIAHLEQDERLLIDLHKEREVLLARLNDNGQ